MKSFDALESATTKAFDRMSNVPDYKESRDADVNFYETLTPEAFDVIATTYGPDNLVEYIKTMEAKRLKIGGTNG